MARPVLAALLALWAVCATAQEQVRYGVTVTLNWDAAPGGLHPADRHWSRLIGFAHAAPYRLFADGETASSGLALVATNGRVSVLQAELAEGRRRNRVAQEVVVPGIDAGVGTFAFELDVNARHRFVSFATMLAPSPDWFTGVSAVDLLQGDLWSEPTVPLWVWDAGVDSGGTFAGSDRPTQPHQSVRLVTHPAFLTETGLRPVGHAAFRRLE